MTQLDTMLFLAAYTSRSQAYAQAMRHHGFVPGRVLLFGEKTRDQGRDLAGGKTGGEIDVFFPDMSEPLGETCRKAEWVTETAPQGDVNDRAIIDAVKTQKPAFILYSGYGGQLVRQGLLDLGIPILHMHSGWLPEYGGSTTLYYSWLNEGRVAVTAFFLDAGIDTGDLILRRRYPLPPAGMDVDHLYDGAIRADTLVRVLKDYDATGVFPVTPRIGDARTYYVIHPVLKHAALLSRGTPNRKFSIRSPRKMTPRPIAVVTGGAGFIGSHMVDLMIERGFTVRVLDNLTGGRETNLAHHKDNPALTLDTRDMRQLEADDSLFGGACYVFHFAGIGDIVPSIEQPTEYMSSNVMGTVHMLEGARFAGAEKFVYAASSSCYGLAATPTTEDHPTGPEYPYALSKYLGEQSVFHWRRVYDLPVNSIRIFNAYGPRVRTTGVYGAVFGVFLKQKLAGEPFTVVGDGTQRRDFIYVTDVARAFLAAAETDRSGVVYNVGAGDPQPINRLVDLLGGDVVYVPKRPGEPDCTWADISKITSELNWTPAVSFEDGVAKMVENIDAWRDAPLWNPESIEKATATWFQYLDK